MPEEFELPQLDFSDPEERAKMILGASGILGGGLIGYQAVKALREGDLFKVDMPEKQQESTAHGVANLLVGTLGMVLFGALLKEELGKVIKEYGRDTLILGASGLVVGSVVIWAIREARS